MAQRGHIVHSIPPTFDANSRVLVLGTMPSPRSREEGFNYGHPRNRFWRVMAAIAGEPVPATNARKRDFCLRHHIALWDVLAECDIAGASDASIANPVPNRLKDITDAAPIEAVFCTGAKAHALYTRLCEAEVGMPAVKLPSTSPANAACSLERLVDAYRAVFAHEHPFAPPTLDVPEVVALEQAIAAGGTSLAELMDRAGAALAWRVGRLLEARRAAGEPVGPVVILCGNGNNGGDGWVAARLLAQQGVAVAVLSAKRPGEITAQPAHDAAVASAGELRSLGGRVVAASELRGMMGRGGDSPAFPADTAAAGRGGGDGGPAAGAAGEGDAGPAAAAAAGGGRAVPLPLVVVDDGSPEGAEAVYGLISRAQVVVDAILGTGAAFAPRAPFSRWVEAANATRAGHATVAADVPSGVDARTGEAYAPHIVADETVTMMVRKPGLSSPACGRIHVAPLAYLEPLLDGGPAT